MTNDNVFEDNPNGTLTDEGYGAMLGYFVADFDGVCSYEGLHRFERGTVVRWDVDVLGDIECRRCVEHEDDGSES